MLSVLVFQYFANGWGIAALPVGPIQCGNDGKFDIAVAASSTDPDPIHHRTTLSIVWSCLVTIFACTWLAIHPNVPARKESSHCLRLSLRRVQMMVVGLLAPEIIILWAMRQRVMAHTLVRKLNKGTP
jgi:hypothetical protein